MNLRPSKCSVGAEYGDTLSDGASSRDHDRVLAPHANAQNDDKKKNTFGFRFE